MFDHLVHCLGVGRVRCQSGQRARQGPRAAPVADACALSEGAHLLACAAVFRLQNAQVAKGRVPADPLTLAVRQPAVAQFLFGSYQFALRPGLRCLLVEAAHLSNQPIHRIVDPLEIPLLSSFTTSSAATRLLILGYRCDPRTISS